MLEVRDVQTVPHLSSVEGQVPKIRSLVSPPHVDPLRLLQGAYPINRHTVLQSSLAQRLGTFVLLGPTFHLYCLEALRLDCYKQALSQGTRGGYLRMLDFWRDLILSSICR